MSREGSSVRGWFDEQRDADVLGLLRVALSVLLFLNSGRLLLQFERMGYFGAYFHLPIVPESWLPSAAGYAALLGLQLLAALLALGGFWPREALFIASSLGLYVLCCDRLQYHNNRYALLLLVFLASFMPCDRSYLLARSRRRLPPAERSGPTFARRLFQIQVSLVYLGSAFGKLLDPDWRGGQVLLLRFGKAGAFWAQHGLPLPDGVQSALSSTLFASFAAKLAISTELFIAIAAWLPQTRRLALWVGLLFHFSIEVSARVELFSWLMGASYLAFVTPELQERRFEYDSASARARWAAHVVRRLDWLRRFRVAPFPAQSPAKRGFCVWDRAGRPWSGLAGTARLAEAIPILFPFWLPLRVLSGFARR